MSEKGKSRKSLLVGIIAAVVILAALLCVLLTQCVGGGGNVTPSTSSQPTTTAPTEPVVIGDGRLYWNVDRALYDGMSEGGMSSRAVGSDGYFHIRFFVDGEMVELLAEDRRIVNNIEARDLMGFVLEGNVIREVIPIEDMTHVEKVGWKFYVQSTGGTLVKVNSSDKYNGVEVILDTKDGGKIYDMTGTAGEIGCEAVPVMNDRVMGVADLDGKLLALYIYDRSNMVVEFDAHCQHCDQTVTWIEWDDESKLPTVAGHYKLMNNIQLKGQQSIGADAKICLDLNGMTVDSAEGKRVYSLHNLNCELAIMDTSENKDGRLVAHGESANQGLCVWVRYGAFYLYSGILDATDAVTTNLGGANVYVAQDRFFYMYGGEVVGGTAKYKYNESTGKYVNGMGGAIYVRGGKFVMNDGVVRDGVAQSIATWANGKVTYQRGNGGNICISNGVFELNGGVIKNGRAGTGGNIFLDGTSEFTMNGGQINNGMLTDPGRNGGNLYINTKVKATINGGNIYGGIGYNASGNVHVAGTLTMNGGVIAGGRIHDYNTGEQLTTKASRNMYVVNGKFYMTGGWIYGGVAAIDSNDEDGKTTTVVLSGVATIADGPEGSPNLSILAGKEKVRVLVGPMLSFSKIGVSASGIFTEETKESNLAHFFSDVEGVDVVYTQNCLAMGTMACLCGVDSENPEDHIGECKGEKLLWGPWTDTASLPGVEGNYYLANDVTLKSQVNIGTEGSDAVININLNGHTVTSAQRAMLVYSKLNVVDHVGGGQIIGAGLKKDTVDHTGVVLLYGGSEMNLYAGTLRLADSHNDLSNGGVLSVAANAEFTMYGGVIDGRSADTEHSVQIGGAVRLHGKMTIENGTVYGGSVSGSENTQGRGAAFYIEKTGTLVLNDGIIYGGTSQREGGAIYITGADASFTMNGGELVGGKAGKDGGAIRMLGNTTVNINGGSLHSGTAEGLGGNISVASGTLTVSGDAEIRDGSSTGNGGNICLYNGGTLKLEGGTISGGKVKGSTSNHTANIVVQNATAVVSGGTVKGNFLVMNSNNKNAAQITVSGSPVITREQTYGLRLFATGTGAVAPKITLNGTLGDGASIAINASGLFTGPTVVENADNFIPTGTEQIQYTADGLMIATPKCLCGDSANHETWCDLQPRLWQPWDGKSSITEPGSYYLTGNATYDDVIKIGVNGESMVIDLDLNGKTLTGTGERTLNVYATLNLVDHVGGGTITGTGVDGNHSAVACVYNGGVLNFFEGTLKLSEDHAVLGEGGTVSVAAGGVMNIYPAGLVDASASLNTENAITNGAAIRVSGTLNIKGGKVIGGKASERGGTIYINKGTVVLESGTLVGGTAKEGGNVCVRYEDASFTMNGGKLEGGTATTNGGAICMLAAPTVTINGGTIESGIASRRGGNVHMVSGVFTLNGGTITGGSSVSDNGGNISVGGGTLAIKSGTIQNGNTKNAGANVNENSNIYADKGTVQLSGGSVTGCVTVREPAAIEISGNPVITGGTKANLRLLTLSSNPYPKVNVTGALTGNAGTIGVTLYQNGITDGIITSGTVMTEAMAAVFFSDQGEYTVIFRDGAAQLIPAGAVYRCVCNAPGADHAHWCDKAVELWDKWDGTTAITSGNYYLTADVTLTDTLILADGMKLDLNGKTVTSNVQLGNAVLTGSRIAGTVTVTGSDAKCYEVTADTITLSSFTGLSLVDSTVGTVTTAAADASLKVSGSTTATVKLAEGDTVEVLSKLTGLITIADPVLNTQIASSSANYTVSAADKPNFAGAGAQPVFKDGVLMLVDENLHIHCVCGGTLIGKSGHTCDAVEFTAIAKNAGNKAYDDGYYFLDWKGEGQGMMITVNADQHMRLCLHGSNIYAKTTFVLNEGSTLSISDCAGGGRVSVSGTGTRGPVLLDGNKVVNLYGGTLDGTAKFPAVNMTKAGAVFNMYGGTITGGVNADGNGGNVAMSQGTFNMYGGTISDGSAKNGGNVALTGGTTQFNMYNGVISGGQSSANGGNISLSGGTTVFTMYSGTITAGEASNHGGNVVMSRGTFVVEGGKILAGKAANKGGNVMLLPANGSAVPVFELRGGSIEGGLTEGYNATNGGNVCVNATSGSATFIMTSGTVSGGAVSGDGGNLYVYDTKDVVEIYGGTISGGSAATGKDVFIRKGTITVGDKPGIGDVFLSDGVTITVSAEKALIEGASIGVTVVAAPAAGESVIVATGAASAQGFSTTMTGCKIDYVDGNVILVAE